ncbi:hypothetical protein CP965_04045 [Halarcobacter mediterraneus]|uniref:TonB C-terminal domain-containing protein n=1 Tax=Halarcobacter mediterraneus TaxID=2023153 RepID=A0A4Q1AZ12_9BACT|nr:TonB family protein [Halarcobacter mediterraneus]RXK14623.1 hypothetical protein CP965_04045 [Halarcobacter mediterraneus]
MKLIIPAFILSIILHLLFLMNFETKKTEPKKQNKQVEKPINKSAVKYVKLKPKPENKPKVIEKTEPKKSIKKVERPKKFKEAKKPPKTVKKREVVKIPKPKKEIKEPKITFKQREKDIEKRSLENFLLAEPIPLDKEMLDEITKSYLDLYGEEYNSFTKVQKVFIQNSIKSIVQITRNHYRFPELAIKLRKNDFNIVEFVLHPNGDISNLRIVKPGNYSFYDKSILEAIEIAYKDYPRPKEPTKIKFYITYNVY